MRSAWIAALAVAPAAALAQPVSESEDKRGKAVDEVVVTATPAQGDRVEIDRRSYDVSKNVQATGGTLADLLRGVPSVDVDLQGSVTLRGDPSVTILVDGKPSGMFQGPARGNAVQSLPADQFERVEVITNPSAADNPEGTGGIINLVSKTQRRQGLSGSARTHVGVLGQYGGGANATYNNARLSVSGDFGLRGGDPQIARIDEQRVQTLANGVTRTSRQWSDFDGSSTAVNGRLAADYDIDARTRIGVQARGVSVEADNPGRDDIMVRDSNGAAFEQVRLVSRQPFTMTNSEVSGSFRRKIGDDQELTGSLRGDRTAVRLTRDDRNIFQTTGAPDRFASALISQTAKTTGAKLDYRKPLTSWGGELKSGYELRIDRAGYLNLFGQGATPAETGADPAFSGAFDYRQEVHGLYTTVQRRFGDLTVLGGVRIEDARWEVRAPGQVFDMHQTRPYPSLHLSYALDDRRKLTGSYSRRIERPNVGFLSPLVQYGDPQNIYSGNPALLPQETDSFELAYDARKDAATLAATLYYREIHNSITEVVRDVGGGVLLFTRENLGDTRRAGASLAVTRRFGSKLSLNLSSDAYWSEIQALNIGFLDKQSAFIVGGQGNVSWTPTARDLFQVDGRVFGKALTPQGYRQPIVIMNLGYRRQLTPSLFVNVAAQNILDTNRATVIFRTPELDRRRVGEAVGRSATVTVTYNFGAGLRRPREPAFEFGGAAPP